MSELLAVFLGGGVGSMLRFSISKWVGVSESGFPYGTLSVNALSCVVLGLAWGYFAQKTEISTQIRALTLVGFCGGFSTFSTFSLETLKFFQAGNQIMGIGYIAISILLCTTILMVTLAVFR